MLNGHGIMEEWSLRCSYVSAVQVVQERRGLVGGHVVSHGAAGAVCQAYAEGRPAGEGERCAGENCAGSRPEAAAAAAGAGRRPHPVSGLQRQFHRHRLRAHAALPILLLVLHCPEH